MIKFLLFTYFLLINIGHANYGPKEGPFQYAHFEFNIYKNEYHRYIRPQLKNILSEFYQTLKQLGPQFEEIIKIKKNVDGFLKKARKLQSYFKLSSRLKNDDEIIEQIQNVQKELILIEKSIMLTQLKIIKLKEEDSLKSISNQTFFKINQALDQFSDHVSNSIASMNKYIIISSKDKKLHQSQLLKLRRMMQETLSRFEILLLAASDSYLSSKLSLVWQGLFRPIEMYVLPENNLKYLGSNLEKFNFVWNDYHLKLRIKPKEVPKKMLSMIKTVHNRWNSILKVIFK